MSTSLLPTTKAQVSGHKFLLRRVEHGLVLGDIRMLHDPLGARRRAMLFGLTAVVLIGLGAGLLAWLRPAADPGDAAILRSESGALYVRVDGTVHPVANLASARLITGAPDDPARIGDELLADQPRGVPLGIPGAPGLLAADDPDPLSWAACHDGEAVTVLAGPPTDPLARHRAVLAVDGGRDWVLSADGRAALPDPATREGRVIRRALGVDAATPRWHPPTEVLNAVRELPPLSAPAPLPDALLVTGGGDWMLFDDEVAPVSPLQGAVLADLGTPVRETPREDIADHPDHAGAGATGLSLPAVAPGWLDPTGQVLCASGDGGTATVAAGALRSGTVELSGTGVADRFRGPDGGAVGVDSGHGHHVVSGTGVRHPVPDPVALGALGLAEPATAPWAVLRLLPEGPALDPGDARRATY
ncbi:type VII secretion protein EccB [Corynebacterium halotolerans]|uniref:Type VII secretion protein EccB n=1 Tax=Corynebacterium halotolerans YIM 70093 = DSM 44683 TaxID=1121362 RepID=M1NPZ6_9CORY|nr:type VII secretion protein EccB [Corynebacterium halotolerans]AGF71562.1 hypothetical protein A605_02740 [Corynebacterium halotolerans YIM 70093 = DSM 44683]